MHLPSGGFLGVLLPEDPVSQFRKAAENMERNPVKSYHLITEHYKAVSPEESQPVIQDLFTALYQTIEREITRAFDEESWASYQRVRDAKSVFELSPTYMATLYDGSLPHRNSSNFLLFRAGICIHTISRRMWRPGFLDEPGMSERW